MRIRLYLTLIINVATLVFTYIIFVKANESGWKAFIPFYNLYTQFKIVKKPQLFGFAIVTMLFECIAPVPLLFAWKHMTLEQWKYGIPNTGFLESLTIILLIVGLIALLVIGIIFDISLAKAFGQGIGFAFGLMFLYPIFLGILAFDKDKRYIYNNDMTPVE